MTELIEAHNDLNRRYPNAYSTEDFDVATFIGTKHEILKSN